MAYSGKEALYHARTISRATDYKAKFVVKAQVQSSGRAQGVFLENKFKGGVHFCNTPEQVESIAEKICGNTIVTSDIGSFPTGKSGFLARSVIVQE